MKMRAFSTVLLVAFCAPLTAEAAGAKKHRLTADEEKLFKLIQKNPAQQRPAMKLDPILCLVARQRAQDLGRRAYFDHVNPDGQGVNFLVTRAGYGLPSFYDASVSGNNLESIAAKSPKGTAQNGLAQWLGSPPHKLHTMGENAFFLAQTRVGVGIAQFKGAPFATYYVFLSAPPNENPRPPKMTLFSSKGKVLATTR